MKAMVFKTSIRRDVELTQERKVHILKYHPDLGQHFKYLELVLQEPDIIKQSIDDQDVLIFYRYFDTILSGKYIAVVVKINERNFILTAYFTRRMKTGRINGYKSS